MISLSPLDRADVALMVGELAARHALSREVVEGLSERTGGVPLFVEEVTRLLLERGEAGGLQAIPPTLQQSLAARLDRLGEAREVAQIGAVLGRDFTYALLSAVGGLDDRALQSALDRLAGADFLIAEGASHEANYRFKHALIQDAAYDSLLKSRRQALHRRAAEVLRDQPERAAAEPEVIAHHFTKPASTTSRSNGGARAGDQALRRSAFQEAIAHLGKAIAMADKAGPDLVTAQARRLKMQTDYGQAMIWSKGFATEETQAAFARAAELIDASGSDVERYQVHYAQWARSFLSGEMILARKLAESFVQEAEAKERWMEAAVGRRMLGRRLSSQGELALARSHAERALALHVPERDMDARRAFGTDTGITCDGLRGIVDVAFGTD